MSFFDYFRDLSLDAIPDTEWDLAEKLAVETVSRVITDIDQFSGIIKIDRKKYKGLNHSFVIVMKEGGTYELFATARKKYVESDVLGQGAFGTVAVCKSRKGDNFAAKYQKDIDDAEQLTREMNFLSRVGDLVEHGFRENKHLAIMQLKEGEELYKQIYEPSGESEKRTFSRKQQLILAIKCLEAVDHLHRHNIVHRDLKPENIMARIGKNSMKDIIIVSPIDYGLSLEAIGFKFNVGVSGTPLYMAPEVFSGVLCKQNDIYSLGVMFEQDFGMQDEFVFKMLNVNPENRPKAYAGAQHFREILKAELEKELKAKGVCEDMMSYAVDQEMKQLLGKNEDLSKQLKASEKSSKKKKALPPNLPQFNSEGYEVVAQRHAEQAKSLRKEVNELKKLTPPPKQSSLKMLSWRASYHEASAIKYREMAKSLSDYLAGLDIKKQYTEPRSNLGTLQRLNIAFGNIKDRTEDINKLQLKIDAAKEACTPENLQAIRDEADRIITKIDKEGNRFESRLKSICLEIKDKIPLGTPDVKVKARRSQP